MGKTPRSKPKEKPKRPHNEKIPEVMVAQIWVLREEGYSLRAIAKEVGCSLPTVQRYLAADIEKAETIVRAQREERAQLWQQTENASLKALLQSVGAAKSILFTDKGRLRRRKPSEAELHFLTHGPRWSMLFKHAADAATNRTQLLTGGATARLEDAAGQIAEDIGPEEILRRAAQLGALAMLGPGLRARWERGAPERAGHEQHDDQPCPPRAEGESHGDPSPGAPRAHAPGPAARPE